MPAESSAKKSVDCKTDATQLSEFKRKLTDQRHDKTLEAADVLTPSPTLRITPKSTSGTSPTARSAKAGPQFTDDTVILQHGSEAGAETFCVRKNLLDKATPLWKDVTEQTIILPKTDTTVLNMFLEFVNGQRDPLPYLPSYYSAEPWRSHAVDAWLFSDLLNSIKFGRLALSHFINDCALLDSTVFLHIENRAAVKSSLRRFSEHWVAWNHSFALDGKSEYAHLDAASLACAVNKGTNDPRVYDIDHWYSPCGGDINSFCMHDPVVRENAVQALSASRRPVPEEGLQWERDHQPGRDKRKPAFALTPEKNKSTASTTSVLLPPPPYRPSVPSKPRQVSAVAHAVLSSTPDVSPPPKATTPRIAPIPPPKPKADVFFKSRDTALRNAMLRSTADTANAVPLPVSPIINRPRKSFRLAHAPPKPLRNSKSYLTLNQSQPSLSLQSAEPDRIPVLLRSVKSFASTSQPLDNTISSSPQPQEPNTHKSSLKQVSLTARSLPELGTIPPPKTPTRGSRGGFLRRAESRVLRPIQE